MVVPKKYDSIFRQASSVSGFVAFSEPMHVVVSSKSVFDAASLLSAPDMFHNLDYTRASGGAVLAPLQHAYGHQQRSDSIKMG